MASRTRLARLSPFTAGWPRVDAQTLRADAAATPVRAVLVPRGIAFATLAGLPPRYGPHCAMVPTAVAALFDSSSHAVTGPTNAVSLFIFATVSPLAAPGSQPYVGRVLVRACLCRAMMLATGLLQPGRPVYCVSQSAVPGSTGGAATLAAGRSAQILAALPLFVEALEAGLPIAAIAALLVTVAPGPVELRAMRAVWRARRSETGAMWRTFGAARAMHGARGLPPLRQPADLMRRSNAFDEVGSEHVRREKREAIARIFKRLDRGVCARSRARLRADCGRLVPAV